MKCRDYNACYSDCLKCDLKTNIPCGKIFDYDTPKKYVYVKRTDHMQVSWNECPTCRNSVGYRPKETDYRCERCGQRILWE